MHIRKHNEGAALLIAVAVMVILLAIGLTFYATSRLEMEAADHVEQSVRAELLANGGFAIARAFLKHDLYVHRTYTSLDHAWSSYFNGAWAAQKSWLFPDGRALWANGVPRLDLDQMRSNYIFSGPEGREPLYGGPQTNDWIYIPRQQDYGDVAGFRPINTPRGPRNRYAVEGNTIDQLSGAAGLYTAGGAQYRLAHMPHLWTDVDSDDDGYKDALWIPMPQDIDFFDDGIDNDLDGNVDMDYLIDPDPATNPLAACPGFDANLMANKEELRGEYALFVYWGGADTLDNNGNGLVDESDEQRLFLTTPLIDWRSGAHLPPILVRVDEARLRDRYNIPDGASLTTDQVTVSQSRVDRLDNDYDFVVNNAPEALDITDPALCNPCDRVQFETSLPKQYRFIHPAYYGGCPSGTLWLAAGEPVTEIVGRVAIKISDVAGRVNVNLASGHAPFNNPFTTPLVYSQRTVDRSERSIGEGLGVHEYDMRVLPEFRYARGEKLWHLAMGAPGGYFNTGLTLLDLAENSHLPGIRFPYVGNGAAYSADYELDVKRPGFGQVDDNGNALWLAMDGIDNDGDGHIDEGLNPLANHFGNPLELEGIDEPQEWQRFHPLRNQVAEADNLDNDDVPPDLPIQTPPVYPEAPIIDEIGELGDRSLRSIEEIKSLLNSEAIGSPFKPSASAFMGVVEPLTTIHSTERSDRVSFANAGGILPPQERRTTGMRLDLNYADAPMILKALVDDYGYPANADPHPFMLGMHFNGVNHFGTPFGDWPADMRLFAAQTAVNIEDFRDRNHARTEYTLEVPDDWWNNAINDLRENPAYPALAFLPEARERIRYTVAGIESIRINELMVRPVRRVEAEMSMNFGDTNYYVNSYNLFPGYNDFDVTREPNAAWSIAPANTYVSEYAALMTTENADIPSVDNEKILEFVFRPSPELPPGRYYLIANTANPLTGLPSVTEDQILAGKRRFSYATKYVAPGGNGIRQDILSLNPADQATFVSNVFRDVEVGSNVRDDAEMPGSILLANPDMEEPLMETVCCDEFGNLYWKLVYEQMDYFYDIGYTVRIPEYGEGALHVAIRPLVTTGDPPLFINYFDFSQEPDHEWVELVNIEESGEPIDLSGWKLEVGAPNAQRDQYTVPAGTRIAPGGMLLLAFNKHDYAGVGTEINEKDWLEVDKVNPVDTLADGITRNFDYFMRNGMGLASRSVYRDISDANGFLPFPESGTSIPYQVFPTAPPIPNPLFNLGSVFDLDPLAGDLDFLDNDGNGLASLGVFSFATPAWRTVLDGSGLMQDQAPSAPGQNPSPEAQVSSTQDEDAYFLDPGIGVGGDIPAPNTPWDRIVQLESAEMSDTSTLAGIAEVVLGGGMFPNYPEHNRLDDDGDAYELQSDMIDNNGDGIEGGTNFTQVDGVDEGYRAQNPLLINLLVPGSYSEWPMSFLPIATDPFGIQQALTIGYNQFPSIDYTSVNNPPEFNNPPEWKALVEKRFYPGDAVFVTLKDEDGGVVDRVTYTERDVVNRSIDDGLPCPYRVNKVVITDITGVVEQNNVPPTLDSRFDTWWRDNSMGLDFYRSLERKHPLYHGDLTGTSNRWEASDGNYDDWGHGWGKWEQDPERSDPALLGHQFSASPLRKNYWTRNAENPIVSEDANTGNYQRQFDYAGGPATDSDYRERIGLVQLPNPDPLLDPYGNTARWAFDKARVRNRPLASPGDLLTLPSMVVNAVNVWPGDLGINTSANVNAWDAWDTGAPFPDEVITQVYPRVESVASVILGEGRALDLTAVTSIAQQEPKTLTVTQANAYYLNPDAGVIGGDPNRYFPEGDSVADKANYPAAWAPVFLFALGEGTRGDLQLAPPAAALLDNVPYYFMLNSPQAGDYPFLNSAQRLNPVQLADRWPLARRATVYVSINLPGFDPNATVRTATSLDSTVGAPFGLRFTGGSAVLNTDQRPAEILFEWDGDDGLENGQYDVYLVTAEPLDFPLAAAGMFTAVGQSLVNRSDDYGVAELPVDVELFTDRNGDRRCWQDGVGAFDSVPQPVELERGQSSGRASESLGLLAGITPNRHGVIHYGLVRVENNYLGLFLRNWARPGRLNRFSRVVLAPHSRSRGRINLNTAQTVPVATNQQTYNPLMGVPGFILGARTQTTPSYYLNAGAAQFDPNNRALRLGDIKGDSDGAYTQSPLLVTDGAETGRANLAAELVSLSRPDWIDGRYYRFPSDTVSYAQDIQVNNDVGLKQSVYPHPGWYPADTLDGGPVNLPPLYPIQLEDLEQGNAVNLRNRVTTDDRLRKSELHDLNNLRFDEVAARFRRSANLVTTRSDVFEIIVTAESGYVSPEDENEDGTVNYRGDFITTGVKKYRFVYER